jgi:hypothetical protein
MLIAIAIYSAAPAGAAMIGQPVTEMQRENKVVQANVGERGLELSALGGLELDELQKYARYNDINLKGLSTEIRLANQTITVGFDSKMTKQEILGAFASEVSVAARNLAKQSESQIELGRLQIESEKWLANPRITQIVVSDFEAKSDEIKRITKNATWNLETTIVKPAAACGNWWPTLNSVNTAVSGTERIGNMYFKFTATALANLKCTGSSTFEPDYVSYNYDNKSFFTNSVKSWSSNLPNAYLDTNAFDAAGEGVITIGSHNNSTFTSTANYYTSWRTNAGNATSDTAKVVWQRGYYQWGCVFGPAWCISSDESKIQYAWSIFVPGFFTP